MKRKILFFLLITTSILNNIELFAQVIAIDTLPPAQLQYVEDSLGNFVPFDGMFASISLDGGKMFFIGYDERIQHRDYYYSIQIKENYWSKPQIMSNLSAKDKNDNSFCFATPLFQNINGDIYYERSYGVAVQRKPDIWFYNSNKNEFLKASSVNTVSGESSPSISPDGKKLFFIRNIFHKYGGGIYMSEKQFNGDWGSPQRLPDYINNSYIGEARICADGETLLFSAERKEGKGFRDIYFTKLDSAGVWSKPVNMYFINSPLLEYSPSMPLKGDKLYFNRMEKGKSYIYSVDMPTIYRYKKFIIKDSIIVDNITNQRVELNTIAFKSKSAEINLQGKKLLSLLANLLEENPNYFLEISAYTDNIGNNQYNMKLSQQRAESVVNHLIFRGIEKHRLKAKGYGATMPKMPNDSEQNRALNRRVEFKVINNKH
ncbi:MAG: OmpA family protein [Thermoflexibacter sp.]|jgi:outer membrane protein OmpA-like peptidoglycan-associated protein|nr:OmpA family protein [Thermoflexibacter sp.]